MPSHIRGTDGLPFPTVPIRNVLVLRSSTIALVTGLLIGLVAGYFGGRWHLQRELRIDWKAYQDIWDPFFGAINEMIGIWS